MSSHRRPEIPFSDAPRATCRWCGEPIVYQSGPRRGRPDRRRRWHPQCVDAYNQTDPREARRLVRGRDRGRCAECGLDTYALRRRIRGRGSHRKLRELGFVPHRSLWELDHRIPLIDGGSHELSNLQTLCTPCHRRKTAREASERRSRRRVAGERDLLRRVDAALAASERLLGALAEGEGLLPLASDDGSDRRR